MKKVISTLLVTTIMISLVSLCGCSQLSMNEQPDPVVIYAEKIYPSAIGNYLTDPSVEVPAIDAYMDEYNKNADETAAINYESIKYNKDLGYYYVNDRTTDLGMKFRVDQAGTIVSASIYTGSMDQQGKNVYNVVINAIETAGYKTLMTDSDRAVIQHTLNGFNSVASAKNEVMQIFNGEENFAAKWANNIAEFEIPVKPSELPKPDTSHTLPEIVMPTIEIPEITIDTTIVEGTHLPDNLEVGKQDIDSLVNKVNTATSKIASVTEYNKTTPEGVNDILDDMVISNELIKTEILLSSAMNELGEISSASPELGAAFASTDLQAKLTENYNAFSAATMPDMSGYVTKPTYSVSELQSAVFQDKVNNMDKGSVFDNIDGNLTYMRTMLGGDTANMNVVSGVTGKKWEGGSTIDTNLRLPEGYNEKDYENTVNGNGITGSYTMDDAINDGFIKKMAFRALEENTIYNDYLKGFGYGNTAWDAYTKLLENPDAW